MNIQENDCQDKNTKEKTTVCHFPYSAIQFYNNHKIPTDGSLNAWFWLYVYTKN